MEKIEQIFVNFTDGAIHELRKIIAEKNLEAGAGLRLGVEGGGCAGISYQLDFGQKKDNDLEFSVFEIPVFMNKAHSLYLAGMEVDYQDGLNARGFTFLNPNASSTCGCGSSFGI